MKRTITALFSLTLALALIGCGGGTTVKRVSTDTTIDLSGNWNDVDSRQVAQAMIDSCLTTPWLSQFSSQGKVPVVIVGEVRNKSLEHINVETFVKDLERSLVNSGRVRFVASKDQRGQLRDERQEQQENSSPETFKRMRMETGADLMLIGAINAIQDREGNKSVMFYQVDLELVNLESNIKVWIGDKKIKKYITRSGTKL